MGEHKTNSEVMSDVPMLVESKRALREASLFLENSKVPITILTGFLGAGKSTLLNQILTRKDMNVRFAVIMNEFGDTAEIEKAISIQKAGEEAAEEWLELPNGCLCCTIKTTALQAIESLLIRKAGQIDYILLETTGLADPYPIINSFWADEALECRAFLDGVVCLVDAKNILGQLKEWQVLMQQIVLADVILVNKTDLVSSTELTGLVDMLKNLNPLAKICASHYGNLQDFSQLLGLKAYGRVDCAFAEHQRDYLDLMAMLSVASVDCRRKPRDHNEVKSLRLSTRKLVDRNRFERWLFELLWTENERYKILRAKGLLCIENGAGKRSEIVLQAVQELYEITELESKQTREAESVLILLGRFEDENVTDYIKDSFHASVHYQQ